MSQGNGNAVQLASAEELAAERAVLGSILRDNSVGESVREVLGVDHFYTDAHQKLFGIMLGMLDAGEPVDLVTLANTLQLNGCLEDCGKYVYLAELWDAAPTSANVAHYARIVRDSADRRDLYLQCMDLANVAIDRNADLGGTIQRVRQRADFASLGTNGPSAVSYRFREVEAQDVPWFWRNWMACRAVTVLDGDPGLGKSLLTVDLAARVSRGWSMPPEPSERVTEPGGVLLLNAEDDAGYTMRPRLEAAGADLDLVAGCEVIRDKTGERGPMLPWDLPLIAKLVRQLRIKLLVIDPLMAYLGGEIDAHKDHDVRRALRQFKKFAKDEGVAMLLLRHLNKLSGGPALYRGGSSIGIVGTARCGWIVGRSPEDESVHVLAMNKTNLGPYPESLAYSIEPSGNVARLGWIGQVQWKAHEILGHPGQRNGQPGRPPRELEAAMDWLRRMLKDGAKPASSLLAKGMDAGHTEQTLRDARKRMGIVASKANFGEGWLWSLPSESEHVSVPAN